MPKSASERRKIKRARAQNTSETQHETSPVETKTATTTTVGDKQVTYKNDSRLSGQIVLSKETVQSIVLLGHEIFNFVQKIKQTEKIKGSAKSIFQHIQAKVIGTYSPFFHNFPAIVNMMIHDRFDPFSFEKYINREVTDTAAGLTNIDNRSERIADYCIDLDIRLDNKKYDDEDIARTRKKYIKLIKEDLESTETKRKNYFENAERHRKESMKHERESLRQKLEEIRGKMSGCVDENDKKELIKNSFEYNSYTARLNLKIMEANTKYMKDIMAMSSTLGETVKS